jgi:hypothetical protein
MLRHCKDSESLLYGKVDNALKMPLSYVEKMHIIYYRANNVIIHMEIVKVNFFLLVVEFSLLVVAESLLSSRG